MSAANPAGAGGAWYCVLGLFAFAVQDALVKSLSARYPVLQVLTLRITVVLLLLLSAGFCYGGVPRARRPWLLLARGALAFTAFTSYYLALTMIPLADAAAVYLSAPLFVTALSVPLLGESVGRHRWLAVALGFFAVMVMIGPSAGVWQAAAALPLFSALCYALIPIISRRIGFAEPLLTTAVYACAAYFALCWLATAAVYAADWRAMESGGLAAALLSRWRTPGLADLGLMLLTGGLFILGLLGLTQAYRMSPVSMVAPFEYSYLLWATLLGFLAFGDVPGPRVVFGALAVVACGWYVMRREHLARARRRRRPRP